MPKSTIGALSIEIEKRKDFTCLIKKVVCQYTSVTDERIEALLFDRNSPDKHEKCLINTDSGHAKNVFRGSISNNTKDRDFYFISNNKGKEVDLICTRDINNCNDIEHSNYEIVYVDVQDGLIKNEIRKIANGKIKLYYYNLFSHSNDFAEVASKYMIRHPIYEQKTASSAIGFATGEVIGSFVDFIMAMRFFLLPVIKDNDYKYESHTSIYYRECPHIPEVPALTIHIYPDIEYYFEIGFSQSRLTYYGDNEKKNTKEDSPFNLDFNVKYNNIKYQLNFDFSDDTKSKELDDAAQKGTLYYKTLQSLAKFFKTTADFSQEIEKEIKSIYKTKDNNIIKDINSIGTSFNKIGGALEKSSSWLNGSIDIQPSLSLNWKYYVSEDLSELKKHLIIYFGLSCNGIITIDLVAACIKFSKKAKKATTALAVGSTFVSGGLATLPAILIKFLIDIVVQWLINKFTEGIKFELNFIAAANVNSFTYDSIKSQPFNLSSLDLKLEVRFFAGLQYKNSISFLMSIKVEYDVGASMDVSSLIMYNFDIFFKEKKIGIDIKGKIHPLLIKLEYHVVGGYEIISFSKEKNFANMTKEWEFGEHEIKPKHWEIFDFN